MNLLWLYPGLQTDRDKTQKKRLKELERNVHSIVETGNARAANLEKQLETANARVANLEKQLEDMRMELQDQKEETAPEKRLSRSIETDRFKMLKANLLTDLMKKLCKDTGKTIPDTFDGPKWSSYAKSFHETEVKKATQGFKICRNTAAVIGALKKYDKVSLGIQGFCHESKAY